MYIIYKPCVYYVLRIYIHSMCIMCIMCILIPDIYIYTIHYVYIYTQIGKIFSV